MVKRKQKKRKWKIKEPEVPFQSMLNKIFPPNWIRKKARETGMLIRMRGIHPVVLFWTLILDFGISLQRTITGLKRSYKELADDTIAYSSFYERFNPGLVKLLKEAVNKGLEELAKDENLKLSGKLVMFKNIMVIDNTIIKLHSSLAGITG